MEKRANYYVSAKDVLIWLAALLFVCSAGFRIAYFCQKGADTTTVWFQIVLPVIATLLYAAILLFDGREHFYRTAFPLFLIVIYLAQHTLASGMHKQFVLVHWIVYLALWVLYRQVTAGYYRRVALLWVVFLGVSAYFAYETKAFYLAGVSPLQYLMKIPDLMFSLGVFFTCLSIRTHTDSLYHPTWGDRSDGRRLRTLSPMAQIAKWLKQTDPGCKVVFIGPCIAKKAEAKYTRSVQYVDYAITFEEMQAMFAAREIDLASIPGEPLDNASYFGRIFARSGGLAAAVGQALKEQHVDPAEFELKPAVCNGIEACRVALLKAQKGLLDANFIEGMACEGGCIGGPACLSHSSKNAAQVDAYGRSALEETISQAIHVLGLGAVSREDPR